MNHQDWLDTYGETFDFVTPCVACGDPIDYCQGHGEIGDPDGRAVIDAHYEDDTHDGCHPLAECQVDR